MLHTELIVDNDIDNFTNKLNFFSVAHGPGKISLIFLVCEVVSTTKTQTLRSFSRELHNSYRHL